MLRLLLLLAGTPGCARAESPAPAPSSTTSSGDRVVAVGDLHGDLDNALKVLRLAGVVDEQGAWSGGKTTLVQTGDYTDRGADSLRIMQLLRRLQTEAKEAGGEVRVLLGNHEVMNLHGDWRYVTPGDVAQFGGVEARKQALMKGGEWASWLSTLEFATTAGDAVFVHGGITPDNAKGGLEALNTRARAALFQRGDPIHAEHGPLWYRGFVNDNEGSACASLQKSLDALSVQRMVVGHTTRRDGRIQTRCGGRLHVIDVGIARHYGGNLAAWVWTNGDARALYASGAVDLEDPPR